MASAANGFKTFWNSPAGPKTIHFWAPMMKWGLVIAGLSDMKRPVECVSAKQQLSLAATGAIWTRWSFVITPKNYPLAAVNTFVGATAFYQLYRVGMAYLEEGKEPAAAVEEKKEEK
ncbi:Mitochondrial pyruvate carrier subunit [Mycoemilia scoparia]|uniref:Mitochondrial pyruvate carrier n=1 Tax=Mycoemilia scoparia TaxID=417184 RepID=A0A9W8A246_9FUNG|nr:Mitochondrial pyruvate carrier subunit [Mycoemilia scoparia]